MARPAKQLTEAEKAKKEAEKVAKFKDLGTKRLNKALDAISKLVPLANKAQYTYTPEQVEKINNALERQCLQVKQAFEGSKISTGGIEL